MHLKKTADEKNKWKLFNALAAEYKQTPNTFLNNVETSLTFSWLNESILFIAVSKAFMDSRKAWSCSQSGLLSRSVEIFTAALDIAENTQRKEDFYTDAKGMHPVKMPSCVK